MASAENGGGGARHAACLQCTQLCHRTHGQGLPSSRTPSFYSLLPSSSPCASVSLPIPPAFLGASGVRIDVETAPDEPLHSEVQLEGPSGEIWIVTMQGQTLGDLALTKGWGNFVTDHGLSVGDLLLFKLLSRGFFSVTIYGTDGCEKVDAFTARARLMANAEESKKRPTVVKAHDCENADMETKRRKMECDEQIPPLIIDIEDDEDEEDDLIILSEVQSGNDNQRTTLDSHDFLSCEPINSDLSAQEEKAGIIKWTCEPHAARHISPSCMPVTEQVTGCSLDTKEDKLSHLNVVELPRTPSNADKTNLPVTVQAEVHLQENSNDAKCNPHKEDSTESNDQEASSSDESDSEDYYIDPDYVKQTGKSLFKTRQCDRLKACLAREYMTEAYISTRRTVSAEEREKALLAAKRFKSNLPHSRKLMKESHVYRGFWLSLPTGFSSEHLPSEIQQATLLDDSGKAWSAKWLGARNGLSGGWRKFSLDHGLEEGDVCVFELIDKNRLVIKVHIFRVVELRNELPGRDHYLHKPQSRSLIGYIARKSSSPSIGSSVPVKKMRGALASKNTCKVGEEDTTCLCTPPNSREPQPENWRLNHFGRAVARQLDPLFINKSENRALQSAFKVGSTTKEVTNGPTNTW